MSLARHLSRAPTVTRSAHLSSRSLTSGHVPLANVSGTRLASTTPAYEGHIPLNWFENAFLAVGSAVMSLANPRRGGKFTMYEFD